MGSRPDSPLRYFQVVVATAAAMLLTWSWFDWKGFVLFFPFWIGFEVFFRLRLRALAPCAKCGFDPYLYLSDVDRAKKAIESHWRKKFEERGVPFPTSGASEEKTENILPDRAPRVINAKQHKLTNPE